MSLLFFNSFSFHFFCSRLTPQIVCKIGTHGENQKSSLKRKIFVGGIPPEARDIDLQEAFTGYDISVL
jgi:hypothetical protein